MSCLSIAVSQTLSDDKFIEMYRSIPAFKQAIDDMRLNGLSSSLLFQQFAKIYTRLYTTTRAPPESREPLRAGSPPPKFVYMSAEG